MIDGSFWFLYSVSMATKQINMQNVGLCDFENGYKSNKSPAMQRKTLNKVLKWNGLQQCTTNVRFIFGFFFLSFLKLLNMPGVSFSEIINRPFENAKPSIKSAHLSECIVHFRSTYWMVLLSKLSTIQNKKIPRTIHNNRKRAKIVIDNCKKWPHFEDSNNAKSNATFKYDATNGEWLTNIHIDRDYGLSVQQAKSSLLL